MTREREDARCLKDLAEALAELSDVADEYEASSQALSTQQLLDVGEAALRRIGRIEVSIGPVFAGLRFASLVALARPASGLEPGSAMSSTREPWPPTS